MHARWLAGHGIRIVAAPLVTAVMLTGLGPGMASAATRVSWTVQQLPSPGSDYNTARGIAVLPSGRAWAVGDYASDGGGSQTLISHWNGTTWTQQASPNPAGPTRDNQLWGVAAASSSSAWAVGHYFNGTKNQTLIEHWNGTAWTQQASPNPAGSAHENALVGVAATSPTNAWAVGHYFNGTKNQTLIEHWNGTVWTQQASPNPEGSADENVLLGVAATSATNAWAVGYHVSSSTGYHTLIAHWNGTAWKRVPSPTPDTPKNLAMGPKVLTSVAATSATNAWAVGTYYNGHLQVTLTEHWTGTAWKRVPSPSPSSAANLLNGVTATSATNAWAVGTYGDLERTFTLHWNGTAWKHVPSPNPAGPGRPNLLNGVDANSPTSIWAVGYYFNGEANQALAFHWG